MSSNTGETGIPYNIEGWIEQYKDTFMPPVCLRMMYAKGQMKCFFVGGPNERKDYHLDCGEELFYMWHGDMVLKVVEKGVHRDLVIKEGQTDDRRPREDPVMTPVMMTGAHVIDGQMFLLPACIPHSPQRKANTIGLVFERERAMKELDGLRYFIEEDGKVTTDILYEKWFHCDDLSSLAPIIKSVFDSEQSKTNRPIPGTIPEVKPLVVDEETTLTDPIDFHQWVEDNKERINEAGYIRMYPEFHQFQVFVFGEGEREEYCKHAETWIWQLEGTSQVTYTGVNEKLVKDDSFLVPENERFTVKQGSGSFALVAYQDPTKCQTWVK